MSGTAKLRAIAGLLVGIAFIAFVVLSRGDDGTTTPTPTPVAKNITGRFIEWQAVDDGHGYALFSVTNHGSHPAKAECTVEVFNDFGSFGVDIMTGESIAAGETRRFRVALSTGEGSFLINDGDVKDC